MDDAVLNNNPEGGQFDVFVRIVKPGSAVELPSVPRTNDIVAVQIALPQRTAGMRASAFDAMQRSIDVANGIERLAGLDFCDSSRRELRQRFHFQQGHILYDNEQPCSRPQIAADTLY